MNPFRKKVSSLNLKQLFLFNLSLLLPSMLACANPFTDPGFPESPAPIQVFYNEPGQDYLTGVDKKIDGELIALMEEAEQSIDIAVYNLGRDSIIQALIRANDRGVRVRLVGDIDEAFTSGYQKILRTDIDISIGNTSGIQHNKFAIIDNRFLFAGTGNITNSGFLLNNNNFLIIEHPGLAQRYTEEFEQMHSGLYASKKSPQDNRNSFMVGDVRVDSWFSPHEGEKAMDAIIEAVNNAKKSVHYMIFAHTHDELTSAKIRAAQRGVVVKGIHDTTFVSGVSEEAPRLWAARFEDDDALSQNAKGPIVRRDGNEHTAIVGNPGHGGKLHCKTIIVDAGTDDAIVFTGSFNWSNNAINNNDENLLAIYDKKISNAFMQQWDSIWEIGIDLLKTDDNPDGRWSRVTGDTADKGDVIISEVNWAGFYRALTDDRTAKGDYIELKNRSGRTLDLSHWILQWGLDDDRNHFAIPDSRNDYQEQPLQNRLPANYFDDSGNYVTDNNHFILYAQNHTLFDFDNEENAPNSIKISGTKGFDLNGRGLKLRLYDKQMNLIDEVGDGGPAFTGNDPNDNPSNPFLQPMYRWDYQFYLEDEEGKGASDGRFPSAWYQPGTPATSAITLDQSGTLTDSGGDLAVNDGTTGFGSGLCPGGFNFGRLTTNPGTADEELVLFRYNGTDADDGTRDLLKNAQIVGDGSSVSYASGDKLECYLPEVSGPATWQSAQSQLQLQAGDGAVFPDPANTNGDYSDGNTTRPLTNGFTILLTDLDADPANDTPPILLDYGGRDSDNDLLTKLECDSCVDGNQYSIHFLGWANPGEDVANIYFNRGTPYRINPLAPPARLLNARLTGTNRLRVQFDKPLSLSGGILDTGNFNITGNSISSIFYGDNAADECGDDPACFVFRLGSSTVASQEFLLSQTGSISDRSGLTVSGQSAAFSGFSGTPADAIIHEVAPEHSSPRADYVRLLVRETGYLDGLRLYLWQDADPIVLYAFNNGFYAQAGDAILVRLNAENPCPSGEERLYSGGLAKNTCDPGLYDARDGVWDVYSYSENLPNQEGVLFLARGPVLNYEPVDGMCYSNRDGTWSAGFLDNILARFGKLREVVSQTNEEKIAVWEFDETPLSDYNESATQMECVDWSSGTASRVMRRTNIDESIPGQAGQWSLAGRSDAE